MFSFFSTTSKKDHVPEPDPAILLIVVPKNKDEIVRCFQDERLRNGRPLKVLSAQWSDFTVFADSASGSLRVYVEIVRGPSRGIFKPDFVLIRSEVRGVTEDLDFRNSLFALMFGNVPSLNSLHSVYCFLERPVVQAELNRLQAAHGRDRFPVVQQSFFSNHRNMIYGDKFPAVVKLGHAHAGYGKMKVDDHHVMEDVRSLLALNKNYLSVEPFLNGSYDLRIQKIGSNFRCFKRTSMGGSWKTNTGSSVLEQIPMTDQYLFWITEACRMFGGLDICTVDVIHDEDTGRDIIMEVNGSSSGLSPETLEEDNIHIKNLVIEKMSELPELQLL
jgi:hypothetical protein